MIEREMRRREMLSALGRMGAAVISDTSDVELRAICFFAAIHRRSTESLDIQLLAVWNPADPPGIAHKDLERRKLIWM